MRTRCKFGERGKGWKTKEKSKEAEDDGVVQRILVCRRTHASTIGRAHLMNGPATQMTTFDWPIIESTDFWEGERIYHASTYETKTETDRQAQYSLTAGHNIAQQPGTSTSGITYILA